jgi:glutamate racemase
VAQGSIVAEKLQDYLLRHPEIESRCSKGGEVNFLTTENGNDFDKKASIFLGSEVKSEHIKL